MNIDWYDISVKPEDVFLIELKEIWKANFHKHGKPWIEGEHDDMGCTMFELLVTFDDLDEETGKIWDQEVASVGYRPDGKFYVDGTHWQTELTDFHKARISSWCFMPGAPKGVLKEAKPKYRDNILVDTSTGKEYHITQHDHYPKAGETSFFNRRIYHAKEDDHRCSGLLLEEIK